MPTNPYNVWDTRKSLGVMRDVKPDNLTYLPMFTQQFETTEEWIDFEKLPVTGRKLAAFALPLARGRSIYDDSSKTFRFKPAYVKAEDSVDPLKPLVKTPGIDRMLEPGVTLTPMQRLEVLKAQITVEHVKAINRTWNWLAAKALIDGKVTLTGENYPTTLVDFGRAAGHTQTLGVGSRYGDAGVSIVDHIQSVLDTMNDAEFGALPVRIHMGGDVWKVLRKNAEFLDHLDLTKKGGNIDIERGLVSSERTFKVGEMLVGGGSGAKVELWVDNEVYVDPTTGVTTRFLGAKEMVFLGSTEAISGIRVFGMIQDRKAQYQAMPIFPANWLEGFNPEVEYIGHTSAPIMVPIGTNATFKATVVA